MKEIWKDIYGYEGLYKVSNLGNVVGLQREVNHYAGGKRVLTEKEIKAHISSNGYMCVDLYHDCKRTTHSLHRIVATAFIPNTDNKQCVNHIDGIKTNNSINNLEWVTHSENNKHAYDIGLRDIEKSGVSKLTRESVCSIRKMLKTNVSQAYIANYFNVSCGTISMIRHNNIWK